MIRRPPRSPLFPSPTLFRSEAHLTPGLPQVSTDAMQLQTALANLVANAVEATADGGRILISTALEHRLDPDADTTLQRGTDQDRKSTRLNSSHSQISYAVFC